MTFTEAAVEVLRLVGRPLHYKKITELAIEKNLLSHVGKTPEVTMSSRLATMVKKDRGDAPIIKVKAGVFGLREFDEAAIAQAESEPEDEAEVEVSDPEEEPLEAEAEAPAASAEETPSSPRLPGSDVFPEEDDDDEPILGGPEPAGGEQGGAGQQEGRGRRRRRRRRRGGRGGEAGEGLTEGAELARPADEEREAGAAPEREHHRADRERDRGERDRERSERDRDRAERDRDRAERDRERAERDRDRDRDRPDEARLDNGREPPDSDLVGKDLADAVWTVLSRGDRQPVPFPRVADLLVRRGRLAGDPGTLAPTIAASVRADQARRDREGMRPRFRISGGRVGLTDWSLPGDAIRFEQDAARAADRQRSEVRRTFLRRLGELPPHGFAEVIATWLNAEGVVSLRAVRRPGASSGELHLAGTLKRGADETRLALVVRRDGRELGRERVIEMRGALHHYGQASAAWLVTTGQVLSGAREEASIAGAPPCALLDGMSLARAMERVGVGLRRHSVPLATLDLDLLDALRGIEERSDRDRDRDRGDRDRDRGRGRDRDRDRWGRGDGRGRDAADQESRGERDRDRDRDRGDRDRDRDRVGERDVTSPQIAVSLPSGPVMPEETSSPDISAGTDATVAGRAEEERTEPWPTEAAPAEPAEIPFADDEDIEVEGEEDESIA